MKAVDFHAGELPAGFQPDFDPYLFNREKHRLLQAPENWESYHLISIKGKVVLASIHFFNLQGKVAFSPFRSPFGSFQYSEKLEPKALFDFIARVESELRNRGVKKIQIKNPPERYAASHAALLDVCLLNQGYTVTGAELGACIGIDKHKFEDKIESWENRKLKQAHKSDVAFDIMPPTRFDDIYNFIRDCRLERGQSLSMTREELAKTVSTMADDYILFAALKKGELAAASISIRVNKTIVYNFYSAHPKKFDSLSPVVFLMEGIYRWCQKNKVALLDLGTSALEGKPNFSLLDFKLHLGGVPCRKLTFTKEWL